MQNQQSGTSFNPQSSLLNPSSSNFQQTPVPAAINGHVNSSLLSLKNGQSHPSLLLLQQGRSPQKANKGSFLRFIQHKDHDMPEAEIQPRSDFNGIAFRTLSTQNLQAVFEQHKLGTPSVPVLQELDTPNQSINPSPLVKTPTNPKEK